MMSASRPVDTVSGFYLRLAFITSFISEKKWMKGANDQDLWYDNNKYLAGYVVSENGYQKTVIRKRLSDNRQKTASDGCAVMQPLRIIIERKPAAVRKTLI